jgi:1-deoxy-D-xylulose-5-phosphate reductoisomerase
MAAYSIVWTACWLARPSSRWVNCWRVSERGTTGQRVNSTANSGREGIGVVVLGSTGSVGQSTLDVMKRHPGRYRVVALTAHGSVRELAAQCHTHDARYAVISDPSRTDELAAALAELDCGARVLSGPEALLEVVSLDETEVVMAAIVGAAGLPPTLQAARLGKRLLLANKESMVIAGALFEQARRESGAQIVPVDSEHNALFQALPAEFHGELRFHGGLRACGVERLTLTASGGPFLHAAAKQLASVTPEQACAHPNWDMGRKISVDSATLMNKGLEVIEASFLFDAPPDMIDVLVHPQSIVHSLVTYRDGSVLAQLGMPDMRTPIAHALAWPDRIDAGVETLRLAEIGRLEFFEPDPARFPCLRLAFEALAAGPASVAALNAANEMAVQAFLDDRIGFMRIPAVIEETLNSLPGASIHSLEDILETDRAARRQAASLLGDKVDVHA